MRKGSKTMSKKHIYPHHNQENTRSWTAWNIFGTGIGAMCLIGVVCWPIWAIYLINNEEVDYDKYKKVEELIAQYKNCDDIQKNAKVFLSDGVLKKKEYLLLKSIAYQYEKDIIVKRLNAKISEVK